MSAPENPPAFAAVASGPADDWHVQPGMTLRDWFAGQALANPTICTGTASEWQLADWFGNRTGIYSWEIAARQAGQYADAMLAAREAGK